MANSSSEAKIEYVLTVLAHSDLPRPNYGAVAIATGQSSGNNASVAHTTKSTFLISNIY
jgi:hypothetical protein